MAQFEETNFSKIFDDFETPDSLAKQTLLNTIEELNAEAGQLAQHLGLLAWRNDVEGVREHLDEVAQINPSLALHIGQQLTWLEKTNKISRF